MRGTSTVKRVTTRSAKFLMLERARARDEIIRHPAKRLVSSLTSRHLTFRRVLKFSRRQMKRTGYIRTFILPRCLAASPSITRKERIEGSRTLIVKCGHEPTTRCPKERTTHCPKSCTVRCGIYRGICLVNFHFDLRSWRIAVVRLRTYDDCFSHVALAE